MAPSRSKVGPGATLAADMVRINAQGATTSTPGAGTPLSRRQRHVNGGLNRHPDEQRDGQGEIDVPFGGLHRSEHDDYRHGRGRFDRRHRPRCFRRGPAATSMVLGRNTDSTWTNTANYGATVTTDGGTAVPGNLNPVPNSSITTGNLLVSANTPAATLMSQDNLNTTGSTPALPAQLRSTSPQTVSRSIPSRRSLVPALGYTSGRTERSSSKPEE